MDIEEWGRPENLGLRREDFRSPAFVNRVGTIALLLGFAMWGVGAVAWPRELAFLGAIDSTPGRIGASLVMASGALALVVARLGMDDRF
jgi:hypothetical protein